MKDIQELKVPIWKLKPTEMPYVPWYARPDAKETGRDGKPLDESAIEKKKKRDEERKVLEDPLSVCVPDWID